MIPDASSKRNVVIKTVETRDGEVGSAAHQTCSSCPPRGEEMFSRNNGKIQKRIRATWDDSLLEFGL